MLQSLKKQTILSLCNKKVGSCSYSISHMGRRGSLVPVGTLRAEGGSSSVFFQDFQGRKQAMATHRVALKGIKRTYIILFIFHWPKQVTWPRLTSGRGWRKYNSVMCLEGGESEHFEQP